jgi:hypothetical protein
MTAESFKEAKSPPRLLRPFAWFLCLLLIGGMGGSRWTGLAALALFADAGGSNIEACEGHLAADCDASHEGGSDSQSSDSQGSDSQNADSQPHSDLEPVEALAVPELQIHQASPDSVEISTPYSGKRHSIFSSPEPRPAERV